MERTVNSQASTICWTNLWQMGANARIVWIKQATLNSTYKHIMTSRCRRQGPGFFLLKNFYLFIYLFSSSLLPIDCSVQFQRSLLKALQNDTRGVCRVVLGTERANMMMETLNKTLRPPCVGAPLTGIQTFDLRLINSLWSARLECRCRTCLVATAALASDIDDHKIRHYRGC